MLRPWQVHYVCSVRVGAINELHIFQHDNLPTDEESGKVPPVKQKSLLTDGESSKGLVVKQNSLLTYWESDKVMIVKAITTPAYLYLKLVVF